MMDSRLRGNDAGILLICESLGCLFYLCMECIKRGDRALLNQASRRSYSGLRFCGMPAQAIGL
jgi:hypothetical protein